MKNTAKIMLALAAVASLTACAGTDNNTAPQGQTPQQQAEAAALNYFKSSGADRCGVYAGESEQDRQQCLDQAKTATVYPYAEGDYSEQPHVTQTNTWNQSGYVVMIRATKNNEPRAWQAVALVDEGGSWKVAEFKSGVDEPSSDLCYIVGGECG